MIKTLRIKFILITMCSIGVVLGSIIAVINITNYYNIVSDADNLLNVLADNNGTFPRQDIDPGDRKNPPDNLSPETPFATRYFSVFLDNSGKVLMIDTGRIAAISTKTAKEYAETLYREQKENGWQGNYKYRRVSYGDGSMYLFLDCEKELSSFYSFLVASLAVSAGGIIVVFILVWFFSRLALKPVAESYQKQKRFITDASHEIKTPLSIISANTEVLELENGESDWTRSIRNQVRRLSALTEKLVFLSRMDEDEHVLPMSEFSLSETVAETVQSFEAVAEAKGKTLAADIEANVDICGDKESIRQLISLLLDNAVKYSGEGGNIYLRLRMVGKGRQITIHNTVAEIEKGNQDILFERFYRRDKSRSSETGGYGIGLSVAKAIVTAHKGKISAKSEDGASIVFSIIL